MSFVGLTGIWISLFSVVQLLTLALSLTLFQFSGDQAQILKSIWPNVSWSDNIHHTRGKLMLKVLLCTAINPLSQFSNLTDFSSQTALQFVKSLWSHRWTELFHESCHFCVSPSIFSCPFPQICNWDCLTLTVLCAFCKLGFVNLTVV